MLNRSHCTIGHAAIAFIYKYDVSRTIQFMPLLTKGDNSHLSLHRFPIPNNVDEDVGAILYKTKFIFGGTP